MPIRDSTNAQILPANSRAVDVAQEALATIVPIQQLRYHNAFLVAGYPSLVYHILDSGKPCSCHARSKALAGRLGEDGKLDRGQINKLITGGYEFKVNPYGTKYGNSVGYATENSISPQPHQTSEFEAVDDIGSIIPGFENVSRDLLDPTSYHVDANNGRLGAKGELLPEDVLNNLADASFDSDEFGLTDVSCPVCFGTGYVGGCVVEGGWRYIITPDDPKTSFNGTIDTTVRPLAAEDVTYVEYEISIPKGALVLDSLIVWNQNKAVPAIFMVDSVVLKYNYQIVKFADGQLHTLKIAFSKKTRFTHIELQFGLTDQLPYIDFPKLVEGSDIRKLDPTEDVSLLASPSLTILRRSDIIVEAVFGKAFQVSSVPVWSDRNRRVLGWEFQARVVQPQELFALLPKRRQLKQKSTKMVRPNLVQGNNRT